MSFLFKTYSADCVYDEKKKKLSILIVDDDNQSLDLIKRIFENRGHEVTSLLNGIQCISKCKENIYDVILMDYHICDMTGDEVTCFIKDEFKNESFILAYTGDRSQNAKKLFIKSGMNGALIKPISMDLLNDVIDVLETDISISKLKKLSLKSRGNILIF